MKINKLGKLNKKQIEKIRARNIKKLNPLTWEAVIGTESVPYDKKSDG